MLASVRDNRDGLYKELEISDYGAFKRFSRELLSKHIHDDFRPGVALYKSADFIPTLLVGLTEYGYVIICNFMDGGEINQRRLKADLALKSPVDSYKIRWDTFDDMPSDWLVPEDLAEKAITYWLRHEELCPDLNWVGTM